MFSDSARWRKKKINHREGRACGRHAGPSEKSQSRRRYNVDNRPKTWLFIVVNSGEGARILNQHPPRAPVDGFCRRCAVSATPSIDTPLPPLKARVLHASAPKQLQARKLVQAWDKLEPVAEQVRTRREKGKEIWFFGAEVVHRVASRVSFEYTSSALDLKKKIRWKHTFKTRGSNSFRKCTISKYTNYTISESNKACLQINVRIFY